METIAPAPRICLSCVDEQIHGVFLYGPVFGVSLVERCADCSHYPTDAAAALAASRLTGIPAVETDGRWYLDQIALPHVEFYLRDSLDSLRARSIQGRLS